MTPTHGGPTNFLHLAPPLFSTNQLEKKFYYTLGSVRMFDLRHLEHSTIIYEDPQHTPLLRLAWNKQDPNYLATVAMDACEVIILDVRVPCTPVARLNNHKACVNGIAWAPHSSCHICTAGKD